MSDKKYEEWLELMKDTPKEELLKYHYNLLFKVDKQKEVLDKIKEYITTIDTDYEIGCWNKDDEFVDVKKDILELLEEIE